MLEYGTWAADGGHDADGAGTTSNQWVSSRGGHTTNKQIESEIAWRGQWTTEWRAGWARGPIHCDHSCLPVIFSILAMMCFPNMSFLRLGTISVTLLMRRDLCATLVTSSSFWMT